MSIDMSAIPLDLGKLLKEKISSIEHLTSIEKDAMIKVAATATYTLPTITKGTTAMPAAAKFDLDDFVTAAMTDYTATTKKPMVAAVDTTPVVEEPKVKPLVLKAGQVKYSDVFGVVPKNIPDFGFHKFSDIPKDYAWHVPKADPDYVVQTEEAARLVSAIDDGDKVLMTGPTGSGKSSLIKYVCAKMGAPFIRINMSADAESSVLFGQMTAREGSTIWVDGPITEAVRNGGVVLIDEWELMPPEISMGLQNLLEDDGYLFLKEMPGTSEEKTIIPHKNFRIICAGNTVGQGDDSGGFSGTMVQNTATLDRFTTTIHLSYLEAKHEQAIITGKTGVKVALAKQMIKLADLVRSAYGQRAINLTMSPRTLINWGAKAEKYGNPAYAFRVAFYDKLRESDKKAVQELYNKVFSERL